MVQQIAPPVDVGGMIGGSFGEALQQGAQQGIQRGMLQGALQEAGQKFGDPGIDPIEKSLAFIQSVAGIPGSERYVASVLPMLLERLGTEQKFGGAPGAAPSAPGAGGMAAATGEPGTAPIPGAPSSTPTQRPQQESGYLGSVYTPQQLKQEAERVARATGRPQDYQETYKRLKSESDTAQQRRDEMLQRAQGLGYSDWELPLFAESINKYAGEAEPETLLKKAKADVDERLSAFKKLERFDFSSPTQVKNIGATVRDIAKDPYLEAPLRNNLREKGFSTYEIETLLHPLTANEKKLIADAPKGTAFLGNRAKATEKLHDMLEKNINSDTSLVALARTLKGKGVPIEAVRESFRNMQSRLSERQKTELASVESRDFDKPSVYEIFYGVPRF